MRYTPLVNIILEFLCYINSIIQFAFVNPKIGWGKKPIPSLSPRLLFAYFLFPVPEGLDRLFPIPVDFVCQSPVPAGLDRCKRL